jgi:hypothetical protein
MLCILDLDTASGIDQAGIRNGTYAKVRAPGSTQIHTSYI